MTNASAPVKRFGAHICILNDAIWIVCTSAITIIIQKPISNWKHSNIIDAWNRIVNTDTLATSRSALYFNLSNVCLRRTATGSSHSTNIHLIVDYNSSTTALAQNEPRLSHTVLNLQEQVEIYQD